MQGGIATSDPLAIVSLILSAGGLLVNLGYAFGGTLVKPILALVRATKRYFYRTATFESTQDHGRVTKENGEPHQLPFAEVERRLELGATGAAPFAYLVWTPPPTLEEQAKFVENAYSSFSPSKPCMIPLAS